MALSLKKISEAYDLLREYKGDNPYLINLKNNVFAYKVKQMNDFEAEYVLYNHDKPTVAVNKTVKVAEWWGVKKQMDWGLEFTPQKLYITYLLGETSTTYHFLCYYRRSQESAIDVFAPKRAILTDFKLEPYENIDVDFASYEARSNRKLYPYQEEAVKFLIARKRAILASDMGSGKSTAAIVAALADKYEKVLIIAPSSVKSTWKRELMMYVHHDEISIVDGREWNDSKFTIINYDILRNFYTVPTTTYKEKRLVLKDDGKVGMEEKEKTVVSSSKEKVAKTLETSDMFNANFDLIIIDEAHRLSNTTSGIYKIVSDFVKRLKPRGIYALTGTPITNRPINFFNILKIIGARIADDWQYYVEQYCDGTFFYNRKERDAQTAIYLKSVGKKEWTELTWDEKNELNELIEQTCKKIWKTDGASHLDELQEAVKGYYLRRMKDEFGTLPNKSVKFLTYTLSSSERKEYEEVWEEYLSTKDDTEATKLEKYKRITEAIKSRQWLASAMTVRTAKLARECVKRGRKVVIFCSFDDEVERLKEEFGDEAVIHNGKMNTKKKDESVRRFQEDDSVKVFIGNIKSASVGLTLIAGTVAIFNSFSWVSGDNLQAEDRIHRLNQTRDVTIYYQVFKDTFYEEMLDKVRGKEDVISKIIVDENTKKKNG